MTNERDIVFQKNAAYLRLDSSYFEKVIGTNYRNWDSFFDARNRLSKTVKIPFPYLCVKLLES